MTTKTAPNPLEAQGFTLDTSDGSYVMDPEAVAGIAQTLEVDLSKAVRAYGTMTTLVKQVAAETLSIARYCIGANGHPSWNFGEMTDAAKAIIGAERDYAPTSVYGRVFAKVEDDVRRKLLANVRQMRSRVFLEAAIVDYVLATKFPPDSDARKNLGELKWVEQGKGNPPILGEVPHELKKHVADQYRAAKLTVPEKFGGPAKAGKTPKGGPEGEAASASAKVLAAVEALPILAPRVAAHDVLQAVSAASARVIDAKTDVPDRPGTIADWQRISRVAFLTAKILDGKAEEQDLAELASVRFNAAKDKAPVA